MNKDVAAMYDSAAFYAGEVVFNQTEYGFDDNLLSIYDVEKHFGNEHIFLMSMDRSGAIEGEYSKISKLFIPYIAGGDIYLDNGDGTYTNRTMAGAYSKQGQIFIIALMLQILGKLCSL